MDVSAAEGQLAASTLLADPYLLVIGATFERRRRDVIWLHHRYGDLR